MRYLLSAVILLVFGAVPALAEKRFALIIANADYDDAPLINPPNDAALIEQALSDANFEVTVKRDLRQSDLRRAIVDHAERVAANPGAVSFVYYSGHGAADANANANYLIPVKARISRPADLDIEAIELSRLVGRIDAANPKASFVVIDACRNFPFPPGTKDLTKGFVPEREKLGTIIAFAAGPGQVASDEGQGGGPYARALASSIRQKGADALTVFKSVQRTVARETGQKQVPWIRDGLLDTFYFVPSTGGTQPTAPTTTPVSTSTPPPSNPAEPQADIDRDVQNLLNELQFVAGSSPSNRSQLEKAIRGYQRAAGVSVTGRATTRLRADLLNARADGFSNYRCRTVSTPSEVCEDEERTRTVAGSEENTFPYTFQLACGAAQFCNIYTGYCDYEGAANWCETDPGDAARNQALLGCRNVYNASLDEFDTNCTCDALTGCVCTMTGTCVNSSNVPKTETYTEEVCRTETRREEVCSCLAEDVCPS